MFAHLYCNNGGEILIPTFNRKAREKNLLE